MSKKIKLENDKKVKNFIQERFFINQDVLVQYEIGQEFADKIALEKKQEYIKKQQEHKLLMK